MSSQINRKGSQSVVVMGVNDKRGQEVLSSQDNPTRRGHRVKASSVVLQPNWATRRAAVREGTKNLTVPVTELQRSSEVIWCEVNLLDRQPSQQFPTNQACLVEWLDESYSSHSLSKKVPTNSQTKRNKIVCSNTTKTEPSDLRTRGSPWQNIRNVKALDGILYGCSVDQKVLSVWFGAYIHDFWWKTVFCCFQSEEYPHPDQHGRALIPCSGLRGLEAPVRRLSSAG